MIERCLKKIQQDQSHCVLITPVWKSRPWYPVILFLLVGQPWLLPRQLDLLRLPGTTRHTSFVFKKTSGWLHGPFPEDSHKKKDFHRRSQISSPLGERKLPVSMKVPGRHGIADVLSGRLIRFQPLQRISLSF